MGNIFWHNLREQTIGVIWYLFGIWLYLWMLIAFFPYMKKVHYDQLLAQLPKVVQNLYGNTLNSVTTIEGFLSGEFLAFFFVIIVGMYAASAAGSAIAEKIDNKNMDFELSQPISRSQYFLAHLYVILTNLGIIVGITCLTILLLCSIYNVPIFAQGVLAFGINAYLFFFFLAGLALLLSTLLRRKIQIVGLLASLLIAFYFFTTLAQLISKLNPYLKDSLYYYYNPHDLLANGTIPLASLIFFILPGIVFIALAWYIFQKRDI
jgi:ABC-2 type transport system permease protein